MNYTSQYGSSDIVGQLFLGIIIAAIAYGAFPMIFALCKPKISTKRYRWLCFLVNFVVFLCFALIGGNYNAAPYLLWTVIFCAIFKRFLPEIDPPIDYSKFDKKSFDEVSSSVPEEVLAQCESHRGSREGITKAAEAFAKEGVIPYEYVPALVEEYMKPVVKQQAVEEPENPIEEPIEEPAEPRIEEETSVCYCRFCGAEIAKEDKFCRSCGAEQKPTEAPASEPQKAVSEKSMDYRAFIAIGAIVLLILVAVAVIVGMVGRSGKAVPTPAPTLVPTATPAGATPPMETSKSRIISPEQYAIENGRNWPTSPPETWSNRGPFSDGEAVSHTAYTLAFSLGGNSDDAYDYSVAYFKARVAGKSDLEAHAIGLKETGLDRKIFGKNEYSQYIYNSALAVGVSEYDAECFAKQENAVWDAAWDIYKHARETGKNHEEAVDSVMFGCFTTENRVGRDSFYNRIYEYRNHVSGAVTKAKKEREELFRLLKEYYEGPGLDASAIEAVSAGQTSSSNVTSVYNGQLFITPSYECLCPFEVSVQGEDAYYVLLKYMSASVYSVDSRGMPSVSAASAVDDIAFYIAPNSTVEIDVPVGVYKLYYACGDTWYGPKELFGEDTVYSTSDELLEFYTDRTTAYGNTIELWAQYSGNFETEYISASQFPG